MATLVHCHGRLFRCDVISGRHLGSGAAILNLGAAILFFPGGRHLGPEVSPSWNRNRKCRHLGPEVHMGAAILDHGGRHLVRLFQPQSLITLLLTSDISTHAVLFI